MSDHSDPTDLPFFPDETWWERELLRNEKLVDKYMQVLGEHPDFHGFKAPEDLSNKVPLGMHPPDRWEGDFLEIEEESSREEDEKFLSETENELEPEEELEHPVFEEEYGEIAQLAQDFALRVFELEDLPGSTDIFYLSAGKIGAHLAGGHGIGYEDENICGNIVKCRWALADCEFCREILEHLWEKTARTDLKELIEESRQLRDRIGERITALRNRVWWK